MAKGPAPKEDAVRPNQGGRTVHALSSAGYNGPFPKLPAGHEPETRKWFLTWAKAPQAAKFLVTDWQRLHQLAFVVDELYAPKTEPIIAKLTGEVVGDKRISPPVTAILAEIRQSEAKLGATIYDRASLYMSVKDPEVAGAAAAERPASRRNAERRANMRIVG
jgi:hypothetical protein